jgi:putative transposase
MTTNSQVLTVSVARKRRKYSTELSRRENCHYNAVAESFFQLLKRERIKKKIYVSRSDARADIFEYIEMFYNSKRRYVPMVSVLY